MKGDLRESKKITGTPASPGVGFGPPWILSGTISNVKPERIPEAEAAAELLHFENAVENLSDQFNELKKESAEKEVGEILESQIMVLKDPELHKAIREKIEEEHYSAVFSIFDSLNEYIKLLDAAQADWAKERTIDVVSIRDQLVAAVQQKEKEEISADGAVVFAVEISPTEMISLSRSDVSGIVLKKAGLTSHAVILAQSLGIPCVVGINWTGLNLKHHQQVVIDGDSGEVILSPSAEDTKNFEDKFTVKKRELEEALMWSDKPSETSCGSKFTIRANVEFENELERLSTHGAEGIGLLRTETLLFKVKDFSIDDQMEFYRKVLVRSNNDPVTIRLFDAGGDKLTEDYDKESNPFLGWRGVRMLLDKPGLLRNQIEAIYRVSGEFPGQVKLLVPMISNIEEIQRVKKTASEVVQNLDSGKVPYDTKLPIGIMVEVPAVALMAKEFAQHADFFSIGTNDLTQYTLAVDRGNERISKMYDPTHPAIWKLISMIKEGADSAGIPVSVCGEMASKPELAACFVGLGIAELSMTTGQIPSVKKLLCNSLKKDLEQLSNSVLSSCSADETTELLQAFKKQHL